MLFERIESPGLAQYSYLIGDGIEAVVIDPRRDCDVYIEGALVEEMRIAHILETHRHEDFVVGSVELAARTGARIWHADAQLPYRYGEAVADGQTWEIGNLTLTALHTPGHTEGSMSYVLSAGDGAPWMVFTGDALFAGEVGRVDFLGMERAPEMAGRLYDSIFGKLLPLGDGVILCPGHGFGSACGSTIADRPWSTLGLERQLNPRLQNTVRAAFIDDVVRQLLTPPYFARMEAWNVEGPPLIGSLTAPKALSAEEIAAFMAATPEAVLLDVRDVVSFAGGHIPGAFSIPWVRLPTQTGWFVPYDVPILLITGERNPMTVVRYLARLGYDNIAGFLAGDVLAWIVARQPVETTTLVPPRQILENPDDFWVLDIRVDYELASGVIPGSRHVPLQELPGRMDEIPRDKQVVAYCRTGPRSIIAAGLLQQQGFDRVSIVAGGIVAWRDAGLPLA